MKSNKMFLMGAALSGLVMAGCQTSGESKTSTSGSSSAVQGECHGINSCKGHGDCGGKGYSCAGKNSCKGKGWKKMTKADCSAKKGTFKAG